MPKVADMKFYRVSYNPIIMAVNEDEAAEIAFELCNKGEVFQAKELYPVNERVLWLINMLDLTRNMWLTWEEKTDELFKLFQLKFKMDILTYGEFVDLLEGADRYGDQILEDLENERQYPSESN